MAYPQILRKRHRFELSALARDGRFPRLARQLLKEELFESDKIGPSVCRVLESRPTPELVAEVVRKLDVESSKSIVWVVGQWQCRAAVPIVSEALDSWEFAQRTEDDYHGAVYALRRCADPASGPVLVRALEKIEQTALYKTPVARLNALEGLVRMGAQFPAGKATLLREIASERRFSRFRMVALAGLARHEPAAGLAQMLREIEAAPPSALPEFLKWLAVTRLPDAVPVLKKHLTHRYRPVAEAAARALLTLGDGTGLPILHERRFRWDYDNGLAQHLLAYWRADTPATEVQMIRDTLDALYYRLVWTRCASRADWAKELARWPQED